jgi:hypothetical protein
LHKGNIAVEKRLADRIALVVVPSTGKGKEFGLEVGDPAYGAGVAKALGIDLKVREMEMTQEPT